ncbi:MAG: hypothetical protein WA459_22365 [Stellaceae bacterium]
MKVCARSLTFTIPGAPGVTITAKEDGSGKIDFTATVNNSGPQMGDFRGLFFGFGFRDSDPTLRGGIAVSGADVTASATQMGDDNVIKIAPGVNMDGQGIAQG